MRRNPDIERQILIAIELTRCDEDPDLSALNASKNEIFYHMRLLNDAGYLIAIDAEKDDSPFEMIPVRLTMLGHEYIESVRDEDVWRKVKEGAETVGDFSLDLLWKLAKGLVREKVKNTLDWN